MFMNLNTKILFLVIFVITSCGKGNLNSKISKRKINLCCLEDLELCNLSSLDSNKNIITNKARSKVLFCFNGSCSICFYKCVEFIMLFEKKLKANDIDIFFVFIAENKEEALYNFDKTQIKELLYFDLSERFIKKNKLNFKNETLVLFHNESHTVLFKDLLNSKEEKKLFLKIVNES